MCSVRQSPTPTAPNLSATWDDDGDIGAGDDNAMVVVVRFRDSNDGFARENLNEGGEQDASSKTSEYLHIRDGDGDNNGDDDDDDESDAHNISDDDGSGNDLDYESMRKYLCVVAAISICVHLWQYRNDKSFHHSGDKVTMMMVIR
jgi:hypothetical protein